MANRFLRKFFIIIIFGRILACRGIYVVTKIHPLKKHKNRKIMDLLDSLDVFRRGTSLGQGLFDIISHLFGRKKSQLMKKTDTINKLIKGSIDNKIN